MQFRRGSHREVQRSPSALRRVSNVASFARRIRLALVTKRLTRRKGEERKRRQGMRREKASRLNSEKISRLYRRLDFELRSFAGSSLKLTFLPVPELNLLTVLAPPGNVRRRGTSRGAAQSHVSSLHHHHIRAGVVVQNIGRHCRQKSASVKISYELSEP